MDFVAKITLVAAVILLGYNLYQLMTGYEAVCDKVEELNVWLRKANRMRLLLSDLILC